MTENPKVVETDVVIAGGGMGGTSAAMAAARAGCKVCLLEATDWLGGQMTSQGVSALDEHKYIEYFGGTGSYYQLREGIRDYYRSRYQLSEAAEQAPHFNPGNGWVSRLCFEPKAALAVLEEMIAPYVADGRLRIFKNVQLTAAETVGDEIKSVTVKNITTGETIEFRAAFFIDATELGSLLPLAGVEYVTGAEPGAETGEPHAHPGEGNPEMVQSFTYPFAVEFCPGEDHTIDKPAGYEEFRDNQPYTFAVPYGEGKFQVYKMFEKAPDTPGSFWTYRRLIDSGNFKSGFPNDIAMINWPGNDYKEANIIDKSPAEVARILDEAKRLALGLLYWLQTEAPRDDGGKGYPELRLRKDVMGTADGLSKFPYIRESRRIKAVTTIREQDISTKHLKGPRARFFPDAVGVGLYPIDIHACAKTAGEQFPSGAGSLTYPFQIPFGALIPIRVKNLLAANKNIGTTHITNGSYRLHPVEWNIGEAAGTAAALSLKMGASPQRIHREQKLQQRLQAQLAEGGVPMYWFDDVPVGHSAFAAVQWLAASGVIAGGDEDLHFLPDNPCDDETLRQWVKRAGDVFKVAPKVSPDGSRAEVAIRLQQAIADSLNE